MKRHLHRLLYRIGKARHMDITYLAKGGFWIGISQVVLMLSSFGLSLIYANFLSPETLGTYRYILSIAAFLTIFTLPGMNTALSQAVARGKEGSYIPATFTSIRWGMWGGVAVCIVAMYYLLKDNTVLGYSFLIVALFLPFMDSLNLYDSVLGGKRAFKKSTLYYSFAQITATSLLAISALYSGNIFVLIITYFGSWTLLRFILTLWTIHNNKINDEVDTMVISNGKHLTLINTINLVANHIDKILVFQLIGAGSLALYVVAIGPIDIAKSFIGRMISTLALTKYATKNINDLKQHVFRWTGLIMIVLIPAIFVYLIVVPYFFSIFFPYYSASVPYALLYGFILAGSAYVLPHTALNAIMAKRTLSYFNATTASINIALIVVFTYSFGLTGLIIARIIAQYLNVGTALFLLKRL